MCLLAQHLTAVRSAAKVCGAEKVAVKLDRAGFYPAGGGRFFATIEPAPRLSPIHLTEHGEIKRKLCKAVVAGLPGDIALREMALVKRSMGWENESLQIRQLPDDQVPVGECLADQLILPFALAGGGSFVTQPPTRHTLTNIDVVQRFLEIGVKADQSGRDRWTISFEKRG